MAISFFIPSSTVLGEGKVRDRRSEGRKVWMTGWGQDCYGAEAGVWVHIQTHRGPVAPSTAGPGMLSQEASRNWLPTLQPGSLGRLQAGRHWPQQWSHQPGALLFLARGWQSLPSHGHLVGPCCWGWSRQYLPSRSQRQ